MRISMWVEYSKCEVSKIERNTSFELIIADLFTGLCQNTRLYVIVLQKHLDAPRLYCRYKCIYLRIAQLLYACKMLQIIQVTQVIANACIVTYYHLVL